MTKNPKENQMKAPTITSDYGLKDCVNLSPSTAVSRIIIGIDPGTTVTGYGIIQVRHPTITALDYGCIRPPAKMKLSDRYLIIFESIEQLLEKYKPDALVVETQYMAGNAHSRNVRGTIKLGMACGISILAAKRKGISVYEYTPTKAKKAVVGKGSASKDQVGAMVQRLLNLPLPPYPQDASDALSLAICHAQSCRVAGICKNEI